MAINIPILSSLDTKGFDKAKREFKNLEGVGAKSAFLIKKAALPAAAAVAAIGAAGVKALSAGEAINSANARIAQINESMALFGKETGAVNDRLVKLAETTGRQIGVDNISIKATQAKLLTFKNLAKTANVVGGAFDRANMAALDMAAAGFGTAEGNAVQLGKALENPIKGIAALAKSGVTFTAKEKEKIKTLVESGKLLQAQEMILKAVETQVGGTAKATADNSQKMKEAFSQLSQKIGQSLLPILETVTPYFVKLADWATQNKTAFLVIAGVIGGIATAILLVNGAMTVWAAATKAFTALQVVFNAVMAANPAVLVALAIAALVAGLVVAYMKFDAFRNIVDTVFKGIKTGFSAVVDAVRGYVTTLVGIYKGLFNGIATLWNSTVGKLSFKIPSWVPKIGGSGFSVPNIPMLADGGIVTGPTLAMIGERGPEAVIPLDGRNNGMGGNNVTINVNGGDPNAVVNALRTYMRQNGSIPIKISNAF